MFTNVIGWILVSISSPLIVLVLTRYPWFKRTLGFLFHWGGPGGFLGLKFPASKEGTLLALMILLIIGLIAATQQWWPDLTEILGSILVGLLLLLIPMGVIDYRKSREANLTATKISYKSDRKG